MSFGKVIRIISNILFFTGLGIAGVLLFFQATGKRPVQVFVVSSGSMAPAIPTGSVVVVAPQTEYKFGDVITFYNSASKKETTTHRVVGNPDGQYRTAGDANDSVDPGPIPAERVIGSVRFF